MKKLLVVLLLGLMLVFAAACGSEEVQNENNTTEETTGENTGEEASKGTLRWGTNANWQPYAELMEAEVEALGYDVELVVLDDTMSVDTATVEGSVDFNVFQHKPYLDSFNESQGADLVMVEPYLFAVKMGLSSLKWETLEDIPDGALIGVAQDASNKDRGLRLMQDYGLLTLTEQDDDYSYTLLDIVDNPHNYEFVEVELASMVKSLEDLDAALFQAGYLVSAGLGLDNVLAWSKDDDRFPIGVVVRAEDVDEPWVADVISALTSERSEEVADELWEGARVPLF